MFTLLPVFYYMYSCCNRIRPNIITFRTIFSLVLRTFNSHSITELVGIYSDATVSVGRGRGWLRIACESVGRRYIKFVWILTVDELFAFIKLIVHFPLLWSILVHLTENFIAFFRLTHWYYPFCWLIAISIDYSLVGSWVVGEFSRCFHTVWTNPMFVLLFPFRTSRRTLLWSFWIHSTISLLYWWFSLAGFDTSRNL